jgi:transcriptional regulator with XRE-family HTH domain
MQGDQININDVFGAVLKEQRLEKNYSQATLAERSGLDRTYISLLERGKTQPTLETLFKIALALETTPASLVEQVQSYLK